MVLVSKVKDRKHEILKADPCLFFCWKDGRLVVMVSWVDGIMTRREPVNVKPLRLDLESTSKYKSKDELKAYVDS